MTDTTTARLQVGFTADIRVGSVLAVDAFPEARKPAWQITVDFGERGVLRTSAQVTNYSAADLVGSLVIGAVDLAPKRIAGFISEFLLLGAIGADDGIVRLLRPDDGAQPGDRIG